jgi:hypothetical protein
VTDELFCSFCGKSQSVVRKLIQGGGGYSEILKRRGHALPLVCICNECIQMCAMIMDADRPKDST